MGVWIKSADWKPDGHRCVVDTDYAGHGRALTECAEDTEGHFWAGNDEYTSMVAFCPGCGAKAPTPPTNTAKPKWLTEDDKT
jgi:hypothetical protein